MSYRPFFSSPPRTHSNDDPFAIHNYDHFPHIHLENTMLTPGFPFDSTSNPRPHFFNDPFTMFNSDHFPQVHHENTMSTTYSPFNGTTNPRPHFYRDPFTVNNWDHFPRFHHENTISRPHIPPFHHNSRSASLGGTRTEWHETPDAHVLKAELPGFKKDEVKVNVEHGKVLKISGERKVEKEENRVNWHRAMYSQGKFMRSFTLPENCKPERMTTSFEGGKLTVTVPKADAVNNLVRIPIED